MSLFDKYQERFLRQQESILSLDEYLALCAKEPLTYASAAERMLAGAIGAGGVGDLALTYGYERLNFPLMLFTVVVLILFVQTIQAFGNYFSAKLRNH